MEKEKLIEEYIRKCRESLDIIDVAFVGYLYSDNDDDDAILIRRILTETEKTRNCIDGIEALSRR